MDILDILSSRESNPDYLSVSQIVKDLNSLTELLCKFAQVGTLSFDDDKQLLGFFLQYRNTNDLVFYALSLMKEDPTRCHEEFSSLLQASEDFLACVDSLRQQLQSLDFQSDCKACIKPFEDEYNRCVSYANTCWKVSQEISNRLDYLDERADESEDLMRELDEKESSYKLAHARVDETYSVLQEKQKEVAPLYSFDFEMLQIVVDKLKQISLSVINDIDNLKKGDCL